MRLIARGVLICAALAGCARSPEFDIVIRGGDVYDGNVVTPSRTDVGVKGDRITAIGDLSGRRAGILIDATGRAVVPGFVDVYSGSGTTLLADGAAESHVRQGITTEILGRGTPASWTPANAPAADVAMLQRFGVAFDWSGLAGYFSRLEQRGISVNVGTLVDVSSASSPGEITQQAQAALQAGALGVVTTVPAPGDAAAMAAATAAAAATIAPKTVFVSELGSELSSRDGAQQTMAIASAARAPDTMMAVDLADANRAGTLHEISEVFAGAGNVSLRVAANAYPSIELPEPMQQDMRTLIGWRGTLIGSRTAAVRADGALAPAGSPTAFGLFPGLLSRFVRQRWWTLPEATDRAAATAASVFHLEGRGNLRPGFFADIVVLDPASLADNASAATPSRFPTGIDYVLVNGVVTVTPKGHTGARAGRTLLGPGVQRP